MRAVFRRYFCAACVIRIGGLKARFPRRFDAARVIRVRGEGDERRA
jgi:hypothetical protein